MSAAVQQASAFSPTPSQLTVAYSVCRSIARSSAKNFYYAFLALPQAKRQALCAIYAFMRRCDDITDDASLPLRDRRQKLAEWLDAVHRAFLMHPTDDPVLIALTDTQQRYKIAPELLDQLAYGTAMGRIYLPQEDLEKFDVSPSELHSDGDSARLRLLLASVADRAREYYRSADELILLVDEDSQPALWVLVTIYSRLLEKIAARQY